MLSAPDKFFLFDKKVMSAKSSRNRTQASSKATDERYLCRYYGNYVPPRFVVLPCLLADRFAVCSAHISPRRRRSWRPPVNERKEEAICAYLIYARAFLCVYACIHMQNFKILKRVQTSPPPPTPMLAYEEYITTTRHLWRLKVANLRVFIHTVTAAVF